MKQITFRLKPGQDLKEEIQARTKDVKAGVLLSIVGGLENAVLRMAGSTPEKTVIKEWHKDFEIVGGTGTFSKDGMHIHLSLSDEEGDVVGGHLKGGCKIRLTAEIIIGVFEDVVYNRIMDDETGFKELIV